MIKLGVNSVLFGGFDFATAAKHIAMAGYDGVELAAIEGMCEHLKLGTWRTQAKEIKQIVQDNNLQLLSMEVASLNEDRLALAFEAGAEMGIPIVNVGPGGKMNVEEDFPKQVEILNRMAEQAGAMGVTLCCKAHVGNVIYNTAMTLRAMEAIQSPAFGIDMDPSHIFRAGEEPKDALKPVLSRVKHIHIRDCKGPGPAPGAPPMQACGRGDIDLYGYCQVMTEGGYDGPVVLEVIGAQQLELAQCAVIAAESYGYLNACLKRLAAR